MKIKVAVLFALFLSFVLFAGCNNDRLVFEQHDVDIVFVNVGKADACIVSVDGIVAVIDTGTDYSAPKLIGALNALGVEKVDMLFLTHTHKDHAGGASSLCKAFEVSHLYSASYTEVKDGTHVIFDTAAEFYLPHTLLKAGDNVRITDDVGFFVLGPVEYNAEDDNDNSLVLRLTVNGRTLMFTGDMQQAEEKTLLRTYSDLSADILKVGNHGNRDATSVLFASAVRPSYAIISTDTNEDKDSANPLVISALGNAEVFLTQDYNNGILFEISSDSTVEVHDFVTEKKDVQLSLVADRSNQSADITCNGEEVDISGFMLVSQKTGALIVFPEGTVMKNGQTITVYSSSGVGDYSWDNDKPIKKNDKLTLFDTFGNECAETFS